MPRDLKIINIKEACEILRISVSHGYKVWPFWRDYGVRVLKHAPNARPRFYAEDIYRMLEKQK